MKKESFGRLNLWQFNNLSREQNVKHFITDRNSNAGGEEFTLSFSSSPDHTLIRNNRALLADALGISPKHLVFPSQVHKTKIVNVTGQTAKEDLMETDALITAEKNLAIAVMSADCVPILLYDKQNHVAGAVHSGWRGTVARILSKTLEAMHDAFGTKGEHIVAGIGPSVCQASYEVGEEVILAVEHAFDKADQLMVEKRNGKAKLDLWTANKFQLVEFGVPEDAIEISNLCTVINNSDFFSARKSDKGRFAAGIMLA